MTKFKPVIVSLLIAALAFGAMASWKYLNSDSRDRTNRAAEKAPASNSSHEGYEFEITPMEDLPTLEPSSLWPQDGRRMSAPEFWVIWTTSEFSKCRLWASHGERDWIEIGNTAGQEHYLLIDLSEFDSEVSFMVDFDLRGKRYRSAKRRVSYGRGANFKQREYRIDIDEPGADEGSVMGMRGRDTRQLSSGDFSFYMFPDITLYALADRRDSSDQIRLFVQNPGEVPLEGCVGFMEVYDRSSASYDRALVQLTR